MARAKPENACTTWQDVAECLPAWQSEAGVEVEVLLSWRPNLSAGAYAEVVLYEQRAAGKGPELVRTRVPFPTRKSSGQAGAVLHGIFAALAELENNPWLWPEVKRRRVVNAP